MRFGGLMPPQSKYKVPSIQGAWLCQRLASAPEPEREKRVGVPVLIELTLKTPINIALLMLPPKGLVTVLSAWLIPSNAMVLRPLIWFGAEPVIGCMEGVAWTM